MAKKIVAVFPDATTADAVARDLRGATGTADVKVATTESRQASLRAEMREEVEHTVLGPGSVGPFTREQARSVAYWTVICTLVGAVVALPLAFLPFVDASIGMKVLVVALVGAACGATFGFLLGGRWGGEVATGGEEGPDLAAERGVSVSALVSGDATGVISKVEARSPIRDDVLDVDDTPLANIENEGDRDGRSITPSGR